MKIVLISLFIGFSVLLSSCSTSFGEPKPPAAHLIIDQQTFEAKMGSYCWNERNQSVCVDTAGPNELVKNEPSIAVHPNEKIRLDVNGTPALTDEKLRQLQGGKEKVVSIQHHSFHAPKKEGSYLYAYSINTKKGDVYYAFSLNVKK